MVTVNIEFQRRAAKLVEREVNCCMSNVVAALAGGFGTIGRDPRTLSDLAEQAFELARPIPDYDEAAADAGWRQTDSGYWYDPDEYRNGVEAMQDAEANEDARVYASAEMWCAGENAEPYDRDVYEHWAISSWLADKLEAKGERVDRDFAGLIVWARTTTGQAISIDNVIEEIARETGYASHGPQAQAAPPTTLEEAEQRATAANQALADKLEAFAADRLRAIQAERPKASASFASAMGAWSFYIDQLVVSDDATDELFSRVLQDFGWVCIPAPVALSFEGGALVRKTEW